MADSIDDLRASFGSMRTSFGTLTGAPLLPASPSVDAASRSADLAGTTNLPDLAAGSSGAGLPTIDPLQIAAAFATDSAPTASKIWSGGHINQSYCVTCSSSSESAKRYLLQRINADVFPDPWGVMENIERVTTHVRAKIAAQNRSSEELSRMCLELVPKKSGDGFSVECPSGGKHLWRMYKFIERCVVSYIVRASRFHHLLSNWALRCTI